MNDSSLLKSPPPKNSGSSDELRAQAARVEAALFPNPVVRQLIDGLPGPILVLNRHRQIVVGNAAFLRLCGEADIEAVRGKRPGDAIRCGRAREARRGCGTTDFCGRCGLARAVLASLRGIRRDEECSIVSARSGEAYELLTHASPLEVDGEKLVFVAIEDIRDGKRRRALERIFFHDVLNLAGAAWGLSGLLEETAEPQTASVARDIRVVAGRLVEEIKSQRELLAAENAELQIATKEIRSVELLQEIVETASALAEADGKHLVVSSTSWDVTFHSDPVHLGRVLHNMIENALEASEPGDTVTAGVGKTDEGVKFYVHNPAVMSTDARLHVFERSFSTKAASRGTGTYSMKLLSERYLGGKVGFRSVEGEGTTFFGVYPLRLPLPCACASE